MPRFLLAPLLFAAVIARADVIISEIMYHPATEDSAEEYIELQNRGAVAVDVSGWKFTSGVQFTIPAATPAIPASGYLVVAANAAAFSAKYPAVTNFVAGWTGQLSNSSNTITLEDGLGTKMDEVDYTDDGDWGQRRRQDPPDFGHRGWVWRSDADGFGKSLELINASFDNATGQNWLASTAAEGTPGTANSVAAADIAPVISDVEHFPLVPKSAENVTVSCRVVDDHASAVTVTLHHRVDGAAAFTSAPMFDDGAHDDGVGGDRIFGAILPPEANGTIVEFYITASDVMALTRTWPAPARDYTGDLVQTQNCLYQVDDSAYAGAMPIYRLVMRAVDRTELSNINTDTGTPPFPFNAGEDTDQTHSHARFNATFISHDGTGPKLRYLAGARNRGNGSRGATPMNFNVQFANDDKWNGRVAIALNSQHTPWQLFGSALFRKAGLAGPESRAVQVRVNATNPASSAGAPAYGFYVCNEVLNSDFADHHFPLDSSGNIYRSQRFVNDPTPGGTDIPNGGDLTHHVPAPTETLTQVELYKLNYRKETNVSEDNWSDLIAATAALAKGHSGAAPGDPVTYDADYVASVQAAIDVNQFMRWFAVNAFADNEETNLSNGDGDDYYLYIGETDPRAKLVPYDLDTILGRSGTSNVATHGIFRMADAPDGMPTPMNAFIKHPQFAPIYYGELKRLLDGAFAPAQFNALADAILGGIAPVTPINTIKAFNAARHAHIATLVPLAISITNSQTTGGTALTVVSGYPQTTANACRLIGKAHAADTRSVKVNGVSATWSAWQAQWTADNVALVPGVNRILIQAFDGAGAEIQRAYHSVWFDDASEAAYTGSLAASETWTAAGGPYRITGNFSVPTGVVLTIEPGAVVMLNSTIDFIIASGGQLIAEGTETLPIRYMAAPGVASWGGITINGGAGTPETRLRHVFIEGNSDDAIDVNGADVVLDHLQFGTTTEQYLSLDGASFLVSNCIFPSGTAAFELTHGTLGIKAGGRGIVRDCFFGKTLGYNDVFDFSGGDRPAPILQFINNVCIGSDDDILDLDGTDTWVEGNVFMHVHRRGSPDSASAISGGSGGGQTSEVTIVGNLFYDVDHATTAKQGNFYTFLNNTVVDQNGRGSDDTADYHNAGGPHYLDPGFLVGVFNLDDHNVAGQGLGMYVEGNVIHSAEQLVRFYDFAAPLSTVTFNNNILPFAWTGPGSGNTVADPQLNDTFDIPTPDEGNFRRLLPVIRQKFGLDDCSPARGTGPNGMDKGGVRAFGVSLSGAPAGTTNQTSATLTVGTLMSGNGIPVAANAWPEGSGWTHYKWRLDGGAWSAETPLATPITLTGLSNAPHTVEVVGRNDAGFYQDHADFGPNARVTSATWTVDTAFTPPAPQPLVRINEVLASNTETINFGTAFPDIIELHNAGGALADIGGWGLTDKSALPFKYTIPAGTMLAPGEHKIIYASSSGSVPQPKTGFGLKREGDTLTLTRSAAAGGGVADAIPFGFQLADYSIGRCLDGSWKLCVPSFGEPNVLARTGPLRAVNINEWLADSEVLSNTDFIELHNSSTLPVDVGLCHLTDNPSDWPDHFQIRQLTFIGPGGYLSFKADDDEGQGPDHLNFKLEATQGEIGLFDPSLALIDNVVYGPQSTDVSQGRTPNGASSIAYFTQPTPAGPNPAVVGTISASTTNLMLANHGWRYFQSPTQAPPDDAAAKPFTAPDYDDVNTSGWRPTSGNSAQLFYIETAALTNLEGFAKTTLLTGHSATRPYQTYYFRTHFTWSGPLTGVSLSAKMMLDDGAVIYLNGVEVKRIRVPAGAVTFATRADTGVSDATVETIDIPAGALVAGDNVLAVSVHQQSNNAQSATTGSTDIVFGMKLDATVTTGFPTIPLALNEVLPINATLQNPDGSFAGWIELQNTGEIPLDLGDMSLSNNVAQPRKFVFPAGTMLAPGESLVVQCNGLIAASATNTGFSLSGSGGFVGLYHTTANGGGLHDGFSYGRQLADFSIGRTPNGSGPWSLCVPTRGTLNAAAGLGQLTGVKINEWLAAPASGSDFLELFNTGAQPVALGGNFLSDDTSTAGRFKHLIPALSFIGGSGSARWQRWIADNSSAAEHVNFELASTGESVGFYTSAGTPLDAVTFGAQTTGRSGGRYPDGTSAILVLLPTPAAANQLPPPVDSDGDGLPDSWETANGLDPNDSTDADDDADGDGQSNRAEYVAGTNPQSPLDTLRASLDFVGGVPAIRFTAVAGKSYTVQYKNALNEPTWTKLADVLAQPAAVEIEVQDATLTTETQRFYRVVTPAQP